MLPFEDDVRRLLCDVLQIDSVDHVKPDEDLQSVGLDSLNFIKLVIAIEDRFEVEIPEEKLGLQFIRNIHDICGLIETLTDNSAG